MAQYWLEIASAADLAQLEVVTTGTLTYDTDGGIPVAAFQKTSAYGEYVRFLSVPASSAMQVRCLLRQVNGAVATSRIGPAARISADSAYVYGKNTTATYKLGKRASGTSVELGSNVTSQPAGDAWSWLEIDCTGTTLEARSWAEGSRPESANRTVTDTSLSSGFAGFGGVFNGAVATNLSVIAVGTDGDPAPDGPVGGERQRSRLILTPW